MSYQSLLLIFCTYYYSAACTRALECWYGRNLSKHPSTTVRKFYTVSWLTSVHPRRVSSAIFVDMPYENTSYEFIAMPPFEGLQERTAAAVGSVMRASLGIMYGRGVKYFDDEYGKGCAYVSPDQRLA